EAGRMLDVKVGIGCGTGVAVRGVAVLVEGGVGEPGIDEDAKRADGAVERWKLRRQRAVHGVMGDDEEADAQPALKGNDEWRGDPDPLGGPIDEEDRSYVYRQPRPDDERR